VASVLLGFLAVSASALDDQAPREGATFNLEGRQATLTKLVDLPYVESEYTKLFKFDSYDNPKLKELRERYKLDEIVAPGKDEFDRQVLLMDWVHQQFKKFGTPTSKAKGALEILRAINEGHTFYCSHYADTLISAAASLGWVDRDLALRRPNHMGQGFLEHSVTEMWSNQFRKWVMFDPLFALYVEKDGLPLNAYELRQEWFYNEGRDLTFVIGKERKKYHKADMPIFSGHFAGFGDLTINPSTLHLYAFIAYIPNANPMDAGPDYSNMFITKDKLGEGTEWHTRKAPANPAVDPYFPIDQVALNLVAEGGNVRATFKTMTPNFKTYQVRTDGGEWKPTGGSFAWSLHSGTNRLEAKTINQFGVEGPISTAEIALKSDEPKAEASTAPAAAEPSNLPAALDPIKTVEIGKNRELRVNGKPFFPLSSWAQSPSHFGLLRSLGFNTFCGGNARSNCDAASKVGGYVMPGFNQSVKGHPALLAQIQGDEPDLGFDKGKPRKTAEAVVESYKRLRSMDDTRPILLNLTSSFMVNGGGSGNRPAAERNAYYEVVVNGGDIVSFDVYPIYGWNLEDKLYWVADGVKELRAYAGPAKPVFTCIETSKGSRWITYERQKDVKPEHTRAEVWMAIIRGATGIIYFTHAWHPSFTEFAPTPEMQAELKRLNEQITRLAPAILADPAKEQVSISLAGDLKGEVLAKQYDGFLYLFANNLDMNRKSGLATIQVDGLKKGTKIEVIDEAREIIADEGSFADEFGPLAVHLYRIAR
jgi:hypothetical protein